ncbi:XdhC family protein [Dendrosporobacter sp. 1207_IL3150]|uniref:XdhC family protein n=1 Tax=Dendrosporobacter sp. 1207_IL3150 TaxID=3084054 RepID=UPI002FD8CFCA
MDVFEKLIQIAEKKQTADIITLVSTPTDKCRAGQMLISYSDHEREGIIIDEIFSGLIMEYVKTHTWTKPHLIDLDYGGEYRLFWDQLSIRPSALVLGAGHISQPLVDLLTMVDYEVTVADDRPDFANRSRFPKAKDIICKDFRQIMKEIGQATYSAAIIVTRGHRYDLECLRGLINQKNNYIGMIGSQRRVNSIIAMLTEEGVSKEALNKLHSPIGLDIGAQTPAEIAVSIVSEIIADARGGSCLPLSAKRR